MRRRSSFIGVVLILMLCVISVSEVLSSTDGSVADLSKWDVTSYKVNLLDHRGGSGDIQQDQNGWIHLGSNHLEGGDIKYDVNVGNLGQSDILEVWIDGYSTSNDLSIGPTVFIGTGKNRYEQITRMTGDAWRPFVFRIADDAVYGDITDPSNRNENWRIRYPSSKYETRRIDKSPKDLLDHQLLPIRISMTGVEDFIIKRIEVVAYRAKTGADRAWLYIVSLNPATVHQGEMVTVQLNRMLPLEDVEFSIIDPSGREHKITPRILNTERDRIGVYVDGYPFSESGWYQVKLVDRSDRERENIDIERFEYVLPRTQPAAEPTPKVLSPAEECPPSLLPPIPQAPPVYPAPGVPAPPASVVGPPPVYSRGYTIQIGAFRVQSAAVSLRDRLRRDGYDAYIIEFPDKGGRLYRVRVGRYPDKSLALRDAYRLRNSGFDTWITDLG